MIQNVDCNEITTHVIVRKSPSNCCSSTFSYVWKYDSVTLRGKDISERPWNLFQEIILNSRNNSTLLDLGCGTAFKLLPLTDHFSEITGLDISDDMVFAAKNVTKNVKNIKILKGDNNQLPFNDHSVDTITCMLTNWNANELARVIKPDGNIIIEHVGCEDKIEFKKIFGMDQNGWRGQFLDFHTNEFLQLFYERLIPDFQSVSISNGFWDTCYTEQGIQELLLYTPMIRNYDKISDQNHFEEACKIFKCQQGIKLRQNRVLVHAKGLRNF